MVRARRSGCFSARALLATVVLGALGLSGCGKKIGPAKVTDSEGRSFDAKCEASGDCKIRSTAAPHPGKKLPDDGDPAFALVRTGRYFGACDGYEAGGSVRFDPGYCRALVCRSDAECPAIHGVSTGTCMHGLCGDPASEIVADDSVMLCLAGTGPGRETPVQVERFALGGACGNPCKVPTPCRQP